MPEKKLIVKKSITPASVLFAAEQAQSCHGWLVAEESLGVSGAGDLAIITSPSDYRCANGKKSALEEKTASAKKSRRLLLAFGFPKVRGGNVVRLDDVAAISGTTCTITLGNQQKTFTHPLLTLPGYREPLALAAAAALLLGYDPAPLGSFPGVPGRMSVNKINDIIIIDNANSGTNAETTKEAARYARSCSGSSALTLVIGTVKGDGAVCEGFPFEQIVSAIESIRPQSVIWVGDSPENKTKTNTSFPLKIDAVCSTLEEAKRSALEKTTTGAIVLAVKTWR